jgi:hypothetical protein
VSLLLDSKRTKREGIGSKAEKAVISFSRQMKLVRFGNEVMSTEPLNLGVEVPQLIAKMLFGALVLIAMLILCECVVIFYVRIDAF